MQLKYWYEGSGRWNEELSEWLCDKVKLAVIEKRHEFEVLLWNKTEVSYER